MEVSIHTGTNFMDGLVALFQETSNSWTPWFSTSPSVDQPTQPPRTEVSTQRQALVTLCGRGHGGWHLPRCRGVGIWWLLPGKAPVRMGIWGSVVYLTVTINSRSGKSAKNNAKLGIEPVKMGTDSWYMRGKSPENHDLVIGIPMHHEELLPSPMHGHYDPLWSASTRFIGIAI